MINEYIIRAKKFRTKHSLGQNFLVNKSVIDEIMKNVDKDDVVLEIGPGVGFVTEQLVKVATKVVAVELDNEAISVLNKNLGEYKNFTLINNDILKVDISELFKEEINQGKKIKVIANIPYYITTPILLHLLGEIDDINFKTRNIIKEIVLMVQYEVARRIVADEKSKNKEYGLLSILSNFWADTKIIKTVPKRSFYPSPKVDSALVKFVINENPRVEINPYLKPTIKASFSQRRKNIKNCLKNGAFINVEEALNSCKLDLNLRGENLSIQDFYNLSLKLKRAEDEN